MFSPERALTNEEIKHLNFVANYCLSGSRGTELLSAFAIRSWEGRHPLTIYNELVRVMREFAEKYPVRDDLVEFVEAWPAYVKEYLGTESWEYGYGFVGEAS